LFLLLITSKK